MSRAVTVGLGQRFRSQSRRISSSGEVCCRRSGLGGGPSANVNVSRSPVLFGIAVFLGLFWGAAVDHQLLVGAQIYRDGEVLGIGAGFLVVEAGGGAELLRGFNPVPRGFRWVA